jgi:glycosyltransferase involved in cell wall biosynthesis
MKIALFVPSWPPGSVANGIVTYASQLVPALRRLGHDVYVLTPHIATGDKDPWTIDLQVYLSRITVWNRVMFKIRPDRAFFTWASGAIVEALRELLKSEKLDVFEIEESFGWSFAISRLNLLPVVVRLHGPWFLTGSSSNNNEDRGVQYRRRPQREGKAIQYAQVVTSPSAKVLEVVRDYYGFDLTASRVIPNPLQAASESEIWDINRCSKDTLLFIGRFDKLKGADVILNAFGELAASNPRLTLTFVGPDNGIKSADGVLWNFERFVQNNFSESCRSRVLYRGQMKPSEIPSIRRRSFLTLVASRQEMMPYSILEAMALGCPIVATDVGGIPELIRNQRNGLLVPTENGQAMAAACQTLLDDHALAARLGRQAWRDCRDFYGPDDIARQTASAYQQAIRKFKRQV